MKSTNSAAPTVDAHGRINSRHGAFLRIWQRKKWTPSSPRQKSEPEKTGKTPSFSITRPWFRNKKLRGSKNERETWAWKLYLLTLVCLSWFALRCQRQTKIVTNIDLSETPNNVTYSTPIGIAETPTPIPCTQESFEAARNPSNANPNTVTQLNLRVINTSPLEDVFTDALHGILQITGTTETAVKPIADFLRSPFEALHQPWPIVPDVLPMKPVWPHRPWHRSAEDDEGGYNS